MPVQHRPAVTEFPLTKHCINVIYKQLWQTIKKKKPVYQCYDEFEDESDEEDNLHSTSAIDSEQLSELAEM